MRIEQLHQWEATATHEELQAKYASRGPAMRRRFRVENSRAGTGRLALYSHACRDAQRCGGTVVEVISLKHAGERYALDMKGCPYCKAKSGEPCLTKSGKIREPHDKRWAEYHAEEGS